MASLETEITTNLSQAIKDKDEVKVATLRLLKSSLEKLKKAGSVTDQEALKLKDDQVLKIIRQEVKKRKEANEGFKAGGREELAKKELQEMEILNEYLPPEISEDELKEVIDKIITENSFTAQDFGQVMKQVMAATGGQADGNKVSALVKQKLSEE